MKGYFLIYVKKKWSAVRNAAPTKCKSIFSSVDNIAPKTRNVN